MIPMLLRIIKPLFLLVILCNLIACGVSTIEKEVVETFPNDQPKTVLYRSNEGNLIKREEFYESGRKKAMIEYKDSVPNGKMMKWYENGTLRAEGTFVNGSRVDTSYQYNVDGNLERSFYYQNDKAKIITDYYLSGKKEKQLNFIEDVLYMWYENGQLKTKLANSNGDFIDYYSNGNVQMKGKIEKGKKEGVYYYFMEKGDTLKTITYRAGEAVDSVLFSNE